MSAAPVILVFRVGQLGDTIVSLPAMRAIRAAHPDGRLVLLTDRQRGMAAVPSWDVLGPTGLFGEVCHLEVPSRASDYAAASRAVRRLKPSRLYYLPPMPRSAWQVARDWLFFRVGCGIRDIVGLRPTTACPVRDAAGRLARLEHESDRLLRWIDKDAPAAPGSRPRLEPLPQHRDAALRLTMQPGLEGCRIVAMGPGSKMASKRWPEARFEAVGTNLLRRFPDVRLIVLGGGDERAIGERLVREWGTPATNFMGDLTVWQAAALLERCALYIGNDTGTMHLAASVGTPCVAIFSARDNPGKWEPAGDGHAVLRHDVPCAGCMLTACVDRDLACLKGIGVDDVIGAAAAVLKRQPREECSTVRSSA